MRFTPDEVLAIHALLIARYGGAHGVRDMGLLESALGRIESGHYQDPIQEAAAIWESLSQNHPFVDGNKRTAFAAMDIILRSHGLRLNVDSKTAIEFVMGLYQTNAFRFATLEGWLRKNCDAQPPHSGAQDST
jgi:death-on-curing protein